uniref:Replication factor A C-terminal domain-containing protein n=1 Tax=Kalanchoe fedtschenkoi TaxID=63787 RepID=A0A7N0T7U2_KALFE
MADDRPTTLNCTVVAVDCECLWYRVCADCERSLSDDPAATCKYCEFDPLKPHIVRPSKRLFRIQVSIATDTEVFVVICFDRVAKVLLGCSADELFHFAKFHPFTATTVGRILEGEMLRVTLSKAKNGYSQHLRVASVVPLRTGFQPAISTLKKIYKVRLFPNLSLHIIKCFVASFNH